MKKYGLQSTCKHCTNLFITRPRFVDYCSTPCKNPINRPGHVPWNAGLKMSDEFKSTKMNTKGLEKGWGWNKGLPNEVARRRMSSDQNPNKGGAVNAKRKIDGTLLFPGEKNGMWGKKHSDEVKEICRQSKIKNFKDGIYGNSISKGELELLEKLKKTLGNDIIHQFTVPNYHRIYDIYIPSLNLIVEYDGDYWHSGEKSLNKDKRDAEKALKRGFKIFRYWESTVKEKGIDLIVDDIVNLKGIFKRNLGEI